MGLKGMDVAAAAAAVHRGHGASQSHSWLSLEQKNKEEETIRRRGWGRPHKTMIIRTFNKAIQI